ncbi:MAG TPA: LemA family protein, partial [Ilumatobacteraceae bacterium]|nr:LemA family protein [Ilumatobacteraceae bacterium]
KANTNFLALQEELTATEGRVAYARQFYNDSVLTYNNAIQQFPSVIFASMLKFQRREYFEADAGSREAPRVQF